MKTLLTTSLLAAAGAALILASPHGAAQAQARVKLAQLKSDEGKTSTARPAIAYKAPLRGAPVTRVGGGTRSLSAQPVALSVLAPNETGYTTREKPTLYWYVSEDLAGAVELTLVSTESLEAAAKPALDITLQPPIGKGVHALSLEEHGVALKLGVEYQWFVAVLAPGGERSGDVVAGGTIKRVAESEAVRAQLKQAPVAQRAAAYAGEGIWYDALEQLSRLISADPADRTLREQRADLLEQVGLADAARFDRSR
jgi:hypothetical protein